jgi:glycosyltransferase involved in cell wall biosynthesis
MALISVITPSYNQAAYLEETILSVLGQDFPGLEYIVVDGGSTDGSLDIIHRYQDRISWWVSEPDSGQAEAINKGLSRATGEFVAWINSDDVYLSGAIARAVSVLQADPQLAFVFGDAVTIDADGNLLGQLKFVPYELLDLMAFRIICQPAVFMRRSAVEKMGMLDASYHYLLDHHLWIRLATLAPFLYVPASMAAARHHLEAKNIAQAAGFGEDAFRILSWMSTQPDLSPIVVSHRRRIEAGAHRLNARYLLDGDLPAPALQAYRRALRLNPRFALQHWHRMLYAALSLVGGKGLAAWYYRLRRPSKSRLVQADTPSTARQNR